MKKKELHVLQGMAEMAGQNTYAVQGLREIGVDAETALFMANPYKGKKKLSQGKLTLTEERLSVGDTAFAVRDIMIASPVSGRNLCLTIGTDNYVIHGQDRFNALKYALMFNRLETRMKNEGLDRYFRV